jgi:hypothetical protein
MIGERYALELMRDHERRLVQMNTRDGPRWYVVPGGQVSEETARKIRAHPRVGAGRDGLFPGLDQTWKFR